MIRKQMGKRIIGTKMPGLLASIYVKAARMVIDSYYIPTAEEVIALLSQIKTGSLETDRRILDLVEPGQSYQFMGSPAIFKAAGFREVARAENDRPIVRRILRKGNT